MLFNSIQYLVFFTIVATVYYLISYRYRRMFLLASSYYFYMCWKIEYALLLAASTVSVYAAGILLEKYDQLKIKKWILTIALMFNLGIRAQQDSSVDPMHRVGVVSVVAVIQNCQANANHLAALNAEQDQLIREQQKEDEDIKEEFQILNTMVEGTDDYYKQKLMIFTRQGALQAKEQYN